MPTPLDSGITHTFPQPKQISSPHRPQPPPPFLSFVNIMSNTGLFTSPQPNPWGNSNCGNVNGSYNNTWSNCDVTVTDERRCILEWLSPLAPRLRHRDVRRSQVEGVGDWVLRTDEFINWNTGGNGVVNPVLFCYGDPGVGKTHLRYELTFPWANIGD